MADEKVPGDTIHRADAVCYCELPDIKRYALRVQDRFTCSRCGTHYRVTSDQREGEYWERVKL